jgi:hypothetical protein
MRLSADNPVAGPRVCAAGRPDGKGARGDDADRSSIGRRGGLRGLGVWGRWLGGLALLLGVMAHGASVERSLPANFSPGVAMTVTLAAHPDPTNLVYAVEETVPVGWVIEGITHGGLLDSVRGLVKWGPFLDSVAVSRSLSFQATPPPGSSGPVTFRGQGQFDGLTRATTGPGSVTKYPGALVRSLPLHYLPGVLVPVTVQIAPSADAEAYAVEEHLPPGWIASAVSHGGEWDPVHGAVKWGPFLDTPAVPRTLTYQALPPVSARGIATFNGRAFLDASEIWPSGDSDLPPHPNQLLSMTPATYEPGVVLLSSLRVTPSPAIQSWSLEHRIPAGWTVGTVSEAGVFDAVTRRLKWGPFTDAAGAVRTLECALTPPLTADGEVDLGGVAVFDSESFPFEVRARRFRVHETTQVTRTLPPEHEGGVGFTVTLSVVSRDGTVALSLEDQIPSGWTVPAGGVDGGGVFDARAGRVKWGPLLAPDTGPRTLTYRVMPPGDALGVVRFEGRADLGGTTIPIVGDEVTTALAGQVTRRLPARYTPAVEVSVRLDVRPAPRTSAHAIEEEIPQGWSFQGASEGGSFDPVLRRVKWGPFTDANLRALTYRILPPAGETNAARVEGQGVFDRSVLPITGPDTSTRNTAPRAVVDSATRTPGELFKISAIKLLLNDSDADGDFPAVTGVSSTSVNGATVVLEWPWIYYLPVEGDDRTDQFTYTIGDGFGGTSSALVVVNVFAPAASSQNIIKIETLPNGSRRILFAGVPGFSYRVEASVNLITWTFLASRTASSAGRFEYIDTAAPQFPVRYYRSAWP